MFCVPTKDVLCTYARLVVLLVFACMINKRRRERAGAISKSQTGTLFKWNKFVYPQLIGRKLDKLLRRFATRLKTTHSAAVINGWEAVAKVL